MKVFYYSGSFGDPFSDLSSGFGYQEGFIADRGQMMDYEFMIAHPADGDKDDLHVFVWRFGSPDAALSAYREQYNLGLTALATGQFDADSSSNSIRITEIKTSETTNAELCAALLGGVYKATVYIGPSNEPAYRHNREAGSSPGPHNHPPINVAGLKNGPP